MFHHIGLCILFTIFCTTLLHAEKHSIYNGENKYIIRECVKSKSNQNELTRINNLILQGNYFAAESRIKNGSKNFTTPAEKAIAYMLQSTVAYNQSRYDVSLHLIEKSNSISVKKSKRIYFRNCNNKAKIFLTLGRHNSADSLLKLLIEKEKAAKDIFNLGYSYHYLALIHHYLGHYEQAEEFFLLSIKYNNLSNDLKCKSSNLSFLGLNYCHLRNYSKGMLNLQESIRIREKYSDLRGLANSYLNLNKLYDAMGNQKKLLAAEFKSLSICKTIGDQQCVIGRYIEISNLHMRNNEFNKAEFYYRTALKKVKGLQLKDKLGLIYLGLATIEFNRSAYQQAQIYCDSSVQIFENWDKKDNLIELYLLKSKLYKVLNQTDSALSYAHLSFKMANDFRSSKNSMLACTELSELLEKKENLIKH